ncbi:MAG: DeoR/GlpR transcriptional regulator [Bacteroidetes bacterium]|nr:DeoR/GlpR transcriptional regulator [Bacteroidota bacterium]MCB0845021.1 DeoR/GlpR transcriptional regulator [Bacteroidota bacterium]MCB0853938.1 DeoR/GlpR transcriptional regulator [Bacteroidota bacterium]
MLKEERHNFILEELRTKNKVLTYSLSQVLSVSEDTIRRDLKELADLGQIKKVHGGAVAHSLNPFHYKDREVYALEEKIAIAEKAKNLIQPQQVVFMDGGTTNLELVKRLPSDLKATIITNSIPVATHLTDHPLIEIVFLGGKVLKSAQVTIGAEVVSAISNIRADKCILGTRSIHHQIGISEIDWEETMVKRAMLAASNEVACLVIADKIGTSQPYIIADIKQVSQMVTTLSRKNPILKPFIQAGVEIIS